MPNIMAYERHNLISALLIFSTTILLAQALELPDHIDNNSPYHLSWSSENQTRWDFVFEPRNITTDVAHLQSLIASNSPTISQCQGQKACLFKGGKLLQAYNSSDFTKDTFIFTSLSSNLQNNLNNNNNSSIEPCKRTSVKIHNYCSTHWNPPVHITGNECQHSIEWHSPYSCTSQQTNYAIPCYVHDPSGKLIDLTHLIRSNGSSYEIESNNRTINLNICNEATKICGPNVSSCRSNGKDMMIETGFSNLTTIKYDDKEGSVHLVSLGEFNDKCADKRVKTIVKFRCPQHKLDRPKPALTFADDCTNNVEWPTIRACPVPDVQVPATNCAIRYEPLEIDINLKSLFINQTFVSVSGINSKDEKNKTMLLGLCQGIELKDYRCAGKSSKATSACLIDGNDRKLSDPKNSQIVGSIRKSWIKLEDSRLLLESTAPNKTCEVPVTSNFNYTRQIGTRIEFVCKEKDDITPKFIGFEDCVYVFEWGSSKVCAEYMVDQQLQLQLKKTMNSTTSKSPTITPVPKSTPVPKKNETENHTINNDHDADATNKTAHDMHKDTIADSRNMLKPDEGVQTAAPKPQVAMGPEPKKNTNSSQQQGGGKMNRVHKFFMIGLIVMSLTAFVVVIFILDRKTNFKIPLGRIGRRARQALRPQPVPYSRVSFNDNLDL